MVLVARVAAAREQPADVRVLLFIGRRKAIPHDGSRLLVDGAPADTAIAAIREYVGIGTATLVKARALPQSPARDALIRGLGHLESDVVVLVDIGEFSYADAAQILDIPIGTVMSRLHRGRRILKKNLADDVVAT